MNSEKAFFNWSGGKDSALALHKLREVGSYEIACLLTTVNGYFDRVSMHGVRTGLLEQQAEAIGIPLKKVILPEMPDMETYERIMGEELLKLKAGGVSNAVFGDIFLEDLRKYREDKLAQVGLKCIFPLWKVPTHELIREFIDLGFKAITVCVNDKILDRSYVGRTIDSKFVSDLPEKVDPCGENGEFHSFVYDGPIFKKPVEFGIGEIVYKKYKRPGEVSKSDDAETLNSDDPFDSGFWYCDLTLRP